MKIELNQDGKEFNFTMILGEADSRYGDGQKGHPVELLDNTFRYVLPFPCDMHPDLLATALLTVVLPFAGPQIEMPRAVSATFADTIFRVFKKELTPVNSQLEPRRPGSRPGLAFSGGVDSTACMLLMPDNSALAYCERISHPRVRVSKMYDTYDNAPALRACDQVKRDGRDVYRVQTDHQYIIGPHPDWAVWVAASSPLILMADALDLDSTWNGNVLDSTYLAVWDDYTFVAWYLEDHLWEYPWEKTMATIGLSLSRPTGGISEIGTTSIVNSSPYRNLSSSCANGPNGEPCMLCSKCFRKSLIDSVVNDESLDKKTWQYFAEQPKVQRHFADGELIEIEFLYCFQNLPPIPDFYFSRVQNTIQSLYQRVDYVARWYPRSLEHIPPKYHDSFLSAKSQYLQDFTAEDIHQFENWQPVPFKLPPPSLPEIVITQSRRKIRGAKRRVNRLLKR